MPKNKSALVKNIMTKKVVSVNSETPLLDAYKLMIKNEFNGLPVIDTKNKVVGIVTEYDLLTKGTAMHLPTFIKVFEGYTDNESEKYLIKGNLAEILAFTVKDVMNREPLLMRAEDTIASAIGVFSEHHRVNPIPIVDSQNILTGIISRYDIIKFEADVLRQAKN